MRRRLLPKAQYEPEVREVSSSLEEVHDCLRSSKTVLLIIRLPAINIIYPSVELVRHPKRPVVFTTRHGVWAEEDITRIPKDERHRNGEPNQDKVRRGVRPRSFAFARRRARRGFRWAQIRFREVLGVFARGDHFGK